MNDLIWLTAAATIMQKGMLLLSCVRWLSKVDRITNISHNRAEDGESSQAFL